MAATRTIPIVMAPHGAPLQLGAIDSLARPGGNVTGLSAMDAEASACSSSAGIVRLERLPWSDEGRNARRWEQSATAAFAFHPRSSSTQFGCTSGLA
jgi:hypothetical protein